MKGIIIFSYPIQWLIISDLFDFPSNDTSSIQFFSRTNCPLELRRIWNDWEDYSTNPDSTTICVDGEIGTILKVYREVSILILPFMKRLQIG